MIENNCEKLLAQKIQIQMQMMRNRDAASDRLRADEMMLSISRGEYRDLCKYALIGLRTKESK